MQIRKDNKYETFRMTIARAPSKVRQIPQLPKRQYTINFISYNINDRVHILHDWDIQYGS